MKFCDLCHNMMYIKLRPGSGESAAPELLYACKNCGDTKHAVDTETKSCILNTNYIDDQASYKQYVTPLVRHDPTLPRVRNLPCPSSACTRPKDADHEVIYIKYDYENLRFLYHCCHCGVFWKSGGGPVAAV